MNTAGKILSGIIQKLRDAVAAGVTTAEIESAAERLMREEKVVSAFKGYRGYPGQICTSINEEIVHGIPGGRILKEGDIISLDVGIKYKGFYSDAAVTVPVGVVSGTVKKLLEVTQVSLEKGIELAQPGNHLFDISHAIQVYVEANGFSVVRDFVGHGIGTKLHEDPEIPNYGVPHTGEILKPGMVLAIEPMVTQGTCECRILSDGWTAITKDGKYSAHFEHSVAITENGPEVLTA